MYTHIIFDIDGTLIDTRACTILAFQALASDKGMKLSEEECEPLLHIPSEKALKKLGYGSQWRKANEKWNEFFISLSHNQRVFSGIEEVLKKLEARNYTLSIVTSRLKEEVNDDIHFKEISNYFSEIIAADMTLCHKPHPDPLKMCIERSGASLEETLYVGDSILDYECAKAANVAFLLATWGGTNTVDCDAKKIASPYELISFLEEA